MNKAVNAMSQLQPARMFVGLMLVCMLLLAACEMTQRRSTPTMSFDEAIRANDVEQLRLVLADRPDAAQDRGPSPQPLMLAASLGNTEVLEVLVRAGGNIGPYDPPMSTPLHYAAGGGHIETMQWLLARKAQVDARDEFGKSPLHWTGDTGQIEAAMILIDAGADPQMWSRFGTPMQLAERKGHTEYVQALKDRGVTR